MRYVLHFLEDSGQWEEKDGKDNRQVWLVKREKVGRNGRETIHCTTLDPSSPKICTFHGVSLISQSQRHPHAAYLKSGVMYHIPLRQLISPLGPINFNSFTFLPFH